jgi:hypothetical protein
MMSAIAAGSRLAYRLSVRRGRTGLASTSRNTVVVASVRRIRQSNAAVMQRPPLIRRLTFQKRANFADGSILKDRP